MFAFICFGLLGLIATVAIVAIGIKIHKYIRKVYYHESEITKEDFLKMLEKHLLDKDQY